MRIDKVKIHNFRSIKDVKFELREYSLLVGQNNSGKTNVIDCLRCFFGEKFDFERDFPKFAVTDEESWIELEYYVPDSEYDLLKNEYKTKPNCITLRKYFIAKDGDHKDNKIYAYEGENLSQNEFYGFVQKGKIGKVIYIPAVSRISDQLKLTGPSPFRDLIHQVLRPLIQNSQAYTRFVEDYQQFYDSICKEETEKGFSIGSLQRDINASLSSWQVEFEVDFAPPSEDDIIKQSVKYATKDKIINSIIDVEKHGAGLQRHLIYTLIKLSSEYSKELPTNREGVFRPEFTLILFEEPEVFLHPSQQLLIADSLRSIVRNEADNLQVLVSTHSPHFVSNNILDLSSIIHLTRNSEATTIGYINDSDLDNLINDNQKVNDFLAGTKFETDREGLAPEMEAIKYALWFDPNRCGMFFANHVILVEGMSECALINYFIETGLINDINKEFFVVDCIGKFNIHRFMSILGKLKINHSIIMDTDKSDADQIKINDFIKDQRNEYSGNIIFFDNCLETYLGINKVSSHRKPQHVLYQIVVEKSVDAAKIVRLCGVIEKFIEVENPNEIVL